MDSSIDPKDVINSAYQIMHNNDEAINKLLHRIDVETEEVENASFTTEYRYKKIVSVEFLLFRARVLVENEHINVKSIVNDGTVGQTIKAVFIKRDQYLAQVSSKLTTIVNDISILEKSVYAEQTLFKH